MLDGRSRAAAGGLTAHGSGLRAGGSLGRGAGRGARRLLAVLALLMGVAGAASASVRVTLQPSVVVADGRSTITVSADVRDNRGRIARDGTPVRFTTTAGTITPVAYTSSGVARGTLTAASEPASAVVTVFSGADQASARVQMVADVLQANLDGRVLRLSGRYVAYSEEMRYLDALQDVRVKYRGLTIEASALQIAIERNELRAFGRVGLISGEKILQGERLYLDLTTFDGYVVSVDGKTWFNGFGLNELPEAPKGLAPEFEFQDLSESALSWIGKEALYIPGVKVQLRGARAYVGGIKALRMPYHEVKLDGGVTGDFGQYVGAGSNGLIVDIPLYVHMSPNSSTAVRFRHGERSGFGYFNTRPGFGLDLEEKYGVSGKAEGVAMINDIASPASWGFRWNHTQQFGPKTRVNALVETPAHRDLYSLFNVAQQFTQGNATVNFSASKLHDRAFGRTIDAGFETTAEPLLDRRLFLSFGTRYTDIDGGQFQRAFNRRFDVEPTRTAELNMRLRPAVWQPLPKTNWANSLVLRSLWGTTTGAAVGYNSQLAYQLPGNGMLGLGYTFDQRPTIRTALTTARHNVSATASMAPVPQLRASLFGTMGLDSVSRTLSGSVSYRVTPSWRLELLHSFYQFGDIAYTDYQFGVARKLGAREIVVFYSTQKGEVLAEIAAANF